MAEERLQKLLARAGIASRRAAERLILAGRVSVDGRIVRELGVRADPRRARVEVDGRRIVPEPLVYLVLNKPRGVVSTLSDPEGRTTVRDLLRDVGVRVVPVGRLDYHTSGALLFTNDGEFASRLQHPRGGVPKEYVAKVRGVVDEAGLARLQQSITIEGRATRPAEVRILRVEDSKTWLAITLREGRNRQVRRLGEAAGYPVLRLSRTAHAGITTEGLRPGQWRYLTRDELVALKKAYGVPQRVRSATIPEPEGHAPTKPRPKVRPARAASAKPATGLRRAKGAPTQSKSVRRKVSPGDGRALAGRRGT
ncbi:MAG: pseudouridine synthase [Pseudomonadota bacterium]